MARRSQAMPTRTWPSAQSRRPSAAMLRGASASAPGRVAKRSDREWQYSRVVVVIRTAPLAAGARSEEASNGTTNDKRAKMDRMRNICAAWPHAPVGRG